METTTLIYLLLITVTNLETSKSQQNVCYCPPQSGTFCGHYLMKNVSRSTFCEKHRIYNCVYQEPEEEAIRIKDCQKGEYCLDNQVQEEEGKWIYGATCEREGEELDSKPDEDEITTTHSTTTKKKKKKKSKKGSKHNNVVDLNDVKLLKGNDNNSSNSDNTEASTGDKQLKLALIEYTTQSIPVITSSAQSPVITSTTEVKEHQNSDTTNKRLKESGETSEQKIESESSSDSNTQSKDETQYETEQTQSDAPDSAHNQQPTQQTDESQSMDFQQQREPTSADEERNGNENAAQSDHQSENSDSKESQYVVITTTDAYDNQNSGDSPQDQNEPQLIII